MFNLLDLLDFKQKESEDWRVSILELLYYISASSSFILESYQSSSMMSSEVESLDLKEENLFFLSSEAVDLDDGAFKFSVPIKGQRLSGVSHCLGWI